MLTPIDLSSSTWSKNVRTLTFNAIGKNFTIEIDYSGERQNNIKVNGKEVSNCYEPSNPLIIQVQDTILLAISGHETNEIIDISDTEKGVHSFSVHTR